MRARHLDELRAIVSSLPRADRTRALALIDALAPEAVGPPLVQSCGACRARFGVIVDLRRQLAAATSVPTGLRWADALALYLRDLAAEVEMTAPRTHEQRRSLAGSLRYAADAAAERFTVARRAVRT